jgi:hypothetical protein
MRRLPTLLLGLALLSALQSPSVHASAAAGYLAAEPTAPAGAAKEPHASTERASGKHHERHKHHAHHRANRINHLRKALGLSQTQVDQIKPLLDQQATTARARMQSARQQMEALLTPEQKAAWEASRQHQKQQSKKHWRHHNHEHQGDKQWGDKQWGDKQWRHHNDEHATTGSQEHHQAWKRDNKGYSDRLAKKLGLTADQRAKLEAQHQASREQARKEMRELNDKIASFLTPEQRVKLRAMHQHPKPASSRANQQAPINEVQDSDDAPAKRPSPPR